MIHVDNEYSKINKIVVGNIVDDELVKEVDLSFSIFYSRASVDSVDIKYTKKAIEERTEDLNNLQKIMESRGIEVVRPMPLKKSIVFSTPYWKTIAHSCECPRDQFLVLGDLILETSHVIRNRYFENDTMKEILYDEFQDGSRWMVMPKPIMLNSSFDKKNFFETYNEAVFHTIKDINTQDVFKFNRMEMMLDGAMCLKFGKNILVNVFNRNVELGFQWLERMFPEYNWHKICIDSSDHLDGELTVLREGLILTKHPFSIFKKVPFLKDWEYIPFLDTQAEDNEINLTSETIALNFVVSDKDVFIQDTAKETMKQLDKLGFNVIPVQFRHSRMFGGAIHCSTLELNRD